MTASPAPVARPSSSERRRASAPTDAAPSLALAPTVKTVARRCRRAAVACAVVNSPTSSGPSTTPIRNAPPSSSGHDPAAIASSSDAERGDGWRGRCARVGAAARRRVMASEPTRPPTALTVRAMPASAARRPIASAAATSANDSPPRAANAERRGERRAAQRPRRRRSAARRRRSCGGRGTSHAVGGVVGDRQAERRQRDRRRADARARPAPTPATTSERRRR